MTKFCHEKNKKQSKRTRVISKATNMITKKKTKCPSF